MCQALTALHVPPATTALVCAGAASVMMQGAVSPVTQQQDTHPACGARLLKGLAQLQALGGYGRARGEVHSVLARAGVEGVPRLPKQSS